MSSSPDSNKDDILTDALTYANELFSEKVSDKYLRKQLFKKIEYYLKQVVDYLREDNYKEVVESVINSLVKGEEPTTIIVPEKKEKKKVKIKRKVIVKIKPEEIRRIVERISRIESIVSSFLQGGEFNRELTRLKRRLDELELALQQVKGLDKLDEFVKKFEEFKKKFDYQISVLRFEFEKSQKFNRQDYEMLKMRIEELEDELIKLRLELKKKEEELRRKEEERRRKRKLVDTAILISIFLVPFINPLTLPLLLKGDVSGYFMASMFIAFILWRLFFWLWR